MQREGQPRGIQRLFRLMKGAEAQGNQVHQPQREPQQRTTNQDQTRTPSASLIPEHKAALGAYCEWLDQTIQTDRERRANEPKPKELQVEDWIAYHEMRKSQEPIQFAPPVAEQTLKSVTPEQRKATATDMYKKLVKEVADSHLVDAASILQKEVWKDTLDNPKATVHRHGDMQITLNHKTGLVTDRSQVGISLSYPPEEKDIFFGIGYFENPENFIPEARDSVSKADLQKGVKSYFIERTHRGVQKLMVIPFSYEEATAEFFDRLHDTATELKPETNRRSQAPTPRPQQLAA